MNVDLKSVLDTVRKSFPEAIISGNVVSVVRPEISWDDLQAIHKIGKWDSHAEPWFFRSGKSVKVVFFIHQKDGQYLSDTELTSNNIIMEKEMKSRDVKSMRKDWSYAGRAFWTVVQWTEEGLAHVMVYRAPSRVIDSPDEELVTATDGGRCASHQLDFAIKHTEEKARQEMNEVNDPTFSNLQSQGFGPYETEAHPDFEKFYSHNDKVDAAGGDLSNPKNRNDLSGNKAFVHSGSCG